MNVINYMVLNNVKSLPSDWLIMLNKNVPLVMNNLESWEIIANLNKLLL